MSARPQTDEVSRVETTLLKLLANGRSITALSIEMGMSPTTLRDYRSSIFRKLGVKDLPGAVLGGFYRGLLTPDDIVAGPLRWVVELHAARATLNAIRTFADRLELESGRGGTDPSGATVAAELRRILGDPTP